MTRLHRLLPAAAFLVLTASFLPAQEGRLVFERDLIDLGRIEQAPWPEPLDYPFHVEGGAVVVERLDTSCGCTEARLLVEGEEWELGRPLPEGTRGVVRARFDGTKYQHNKASTIDVRGKGENLPTRLRVQAFILPLFEVRPAIVRFVEVPPASVRQETPARRVRVACTRPFRVLGWKKVPLGGAIREIETAGGPARVEEDPDTGEEHHVRVFEVSVLPDAPEGLQTGQFVGETDLGRDLVISFYADIRGPVSYLPPRLNFQARVGQERTMKIRVRAASPEIEVPRPEVSWDGTGGLQLAVEERSRKDDWLIRVTVPADTPRGALRGRIRVRYPPGSGLPEGEIPVLVTVRPSPGG